MSDENTRKTEVVQDKKRSGDTVLVFKYLWDKTSYVLCFHSGYSGSMQNVEI